MIDFPWNQTPKAGTDLTTRKPFVNETTRHATKTIGSWQLGFWPWFGHPDHRRGHDGDCEPNAEPGCHRVRVLTVGQGDVSALTVRFPDPARCFPPRTLTSVPAACRRRTTWTSVLQAEFLEGLRLEKIDLELGQRFRRQLLNYIFHHAELEFRSMCSRAWTAKCDRPDQR